MPEELEFDDLLGKYLDKNGKVYDGIVEINVDTGEATKSDIQLKIDQEESEKQQNQLVAVHKTIVTLEEQLKKLKRQEDDAKTKILKSMQDNDIWQFKVGNVTISRKKEYERTTIDTKAFQEEMPEIAKQYERTTTIGESLTIKIDKE